MRPLCPAALCILGRRLGVNLNLINRRDKRRDGDRPFCIASPGAVTGRNLTRLGRSWATTTTAAGLNNPVFLDNLYSRLSPLLQGPPKTPVPLVMSSYTPRSVQPEPRDGSASTNTTGDRPRSPQYLTSMRSPQTPSMKDSTVRRGPDTPGEGPHSPTFLRGSLVSTSPSTWSSQLRSSAGTGAGTTTSSSLGRLAMQGAIRENGYGAGVAPAVLTPGGSPITIVYG